MKVRTGFVGNSSSSSFIVRNDSDRALNIGALIAELVADGKIDFGIEYDVEIMDAAKDLVSKITSRLFNSLSFLSAEKWTLQPGEAKAMNFGDSEGDISGRLGWALEESLRNTDTKTKSFTVMFDEMMR